MNDLRCLNGCGDLGAIDPCAQQVKGTFYTGAALRVGGLGVGLFGTYKLLKKNWAAGVVSLMGAGLTWWFGGALLRASALSFAACQKASGTAPLTAAQQLLKAHGKTMDTCSTMYSSDPNGMFQCLKDHPGGQVML